MSTNAAANLTLGYLDKIATNNGVGFALIFKNEKIVKIYEDCEIAMKIARAHNIDLIYEVELFEEECVGELNEGIGTNWWVMNRKEAWLARSEYSFFDGEWEHCEIASYEMI